MSPSEFFRKLLTGRQTKKLKGKVKTMGTNAKVLAIGKELSTEAGKRLIVWDGYYRNDFDNIRSDSGLSLNPFYNKLTGKVIYPGAKRVSSKLSKVVFSEMPIIEVDKNSQERFDEIMLNNDGFVKLRKGAEFGSALGKVYLKFSIDKTMGYPIFDMVYALNGEVTNRKWGIATEGTFYTYLTTIGSDDYWLAEIYSKGSVTNKLMKGNVKHTKKKSLKDMPLNSIPETADLQEIVPTKIVDMPLFIEIVSPIVNNQNPESFEGMSLFANALPQIDDLNSLVNSYYKEFKAKEVKVFYAEDIVPKDAEGNPLVDLDQTVFIATDLDPSTVTNGKVDPINVFDSAIRHESYAQGLKDKMSLLYEACELSASTSSKSSVNTAKKTATEVESEDKETYETKGDYQNVWKNALIKMCKLILEIDNAHFKGGHVLDNINIEFSDNFKSNKTERTDNALKMQIAGNFSRQTTIEIVMEDWNDDRVNTELERLASQRVEESVNIDGMFLGANKKVVPTGEDTDENEENKDEENIDEEI